MTVDDSAYRLLTDGREAFPEILRCIDAAEESIRVNMFIWRDDTIGNRLAEALLNAADRGVKVEISVDRYGMVQELCEEIKRSFFHRRPTVVERCKIAVLQALYPMPGAEKHWIEVDSPVRRMLLSHPNVRVEKDLFKADHSKYYVFDNRLLILGGINIEDKENGADRQGRVYQDYMVRIDDPSAVKELLARMDRGVPSDTRRFVANTKRTPTRRFEMREHYLSILREAEREIVITMAYFSPLREFTDAILEAEARGVRITVLIPAHANFQDDTNRKTVAYLLRHSHGGIRVLLSPKMVHTKLVANEKVISVGSANISKKAFRQLDELNLCVENRPTPFTETLWRTVRENQELSHTASDASQVRYRRFRAWLEGFLV